MKTLPCMRSQASKCCWRPCNFLELASPSRIFPRSRFTNNPQRHSALACEGLVSSPSKSSSLWPSSRRHPGCHSRGPRRRRGRGGGGGAGGGGAGGGGCGARVRKRHILWRAQYTDAKEPCCQNTTICNCFHVSCDDLVAEC